MYRALYLCIWVFPHLLYATVPLTSVSGGLLYPAGTRIKNYEVQRWIASGGFGDVYNVKKIDTMEEYAMKVMNKSHVARQVVGGLALVDNEIKVHRSLVHENIVKMIEVFHSKTVIYVVTEYCSGGDLFGRFADFGIFTEETAREFALQISQGLYYLHQANIIHRDIKLENIFITGDGTIKIGDFGLAKEWLPGTSESYSCGSEAYAAPEVLCESPSYSKGADMWSFGVTLYSMIYGTVVYNRASPEKFHRFIQDGDNVYFPSHIPISEELKDLLNKLFEVEKDDRITIEDLLAHPWFQLSFNPTSIVDDMEKQLTIGDTQIEDSEQESTVGSTILLSLTNHFVL